MVKLAKQAQSVEMRKVYCQTMMQMAQELYVQIQKVLEQEGKQ